MPLSDAKIKAAKATGKEYKMPDSEGLYLFVTVIGSKIWRLRLRKDGKDTTISLGKYPAMKLTDARMARNEMLLKLAAGEELRPQKKRGQTFRDVAEEWIEKHSQEWRERYIKTLRQRLEHDAYPAFGDVLIGEVTPEIVLKMLREIEKRGSVVVAKKVLWHVQQITAYAYAALKIKSDPVAGLTTNVLKRVKPGHFAAVTTKEDAAFVIRSVRNYRGAPIVRLALEFLMLTFVRPGNVRAARWADIDLDKKIWIIPAEQMKMGREHKVPLSRQSLAILKQAEEWEDATGLVFPPLRKRTDKTGMISDATFGVALRAMGIPQNMMSAHGFRSMASSLLNEAGFQPDVIEKQLAHAGKDQVRDIYNRSEYWADRVNLMQSWADMIDALGSTHAAP